MMTTKKTAYKIFTLLLILTMLLTVLPVEPLFAAEENKEDAHYDLIVIGGEPEGVSAAVTAARSGLKVLLLEKEPFLGGLMTLGKLNFIDLCEGADRTLLTRGFFLEFYKAVGGNSFEIVEAIDFFHASVDNEANITLKTSLSDIRPLLTNGEPSGVSFKEKGKVNMATAQFFIDATADADFAAAAGVPYTFGGEDYGEPHKLMGTTLVFELSGVNWAQVREYLANDNDSSTSSDAKSAWGYTDEGYAYKPQDKELRLRGLNLARQKNGNVLVNALVIFGVDVLSEESKQKGIERARKELAYIVPYLNKTCKGFEGARLVGTASRLYIRESRHIIGEYRLSINDVLGNKYFWDQIAIGGYPVDIQPSLNQNQGIVIGNPDRYSVPFRTLIPKGFHNLLVVGKSASFDSLAAGSARVIPLGMCTGQAAGEAAALALAMDMDFQKLAASKQAIAALQYRLRRQGAYLEQFNSGEKAGTHWSYESMSVLRNLGQAYGGYNNNYRYEDEVQPVHMQNMLYWTLLKAGITGVHYLQLAAMHTVGDALLKVAETMGAQTEEPAIAREYLREKGVICELLEPRFADENRKLKLGEAYVFIANIYKAILAEGESSVVLTAVE